MGESMDAFSENCRSRQGGSPNKLALHSLLGLVVAVAIGCVGCGATGSTPALTTTEMPAVGEGNEGALPIWHVGERWIYEISAQGVEYTMTSEVTGEDVIDGTECYVMESTYDPPWGGTYANSTEAVGKETFEIVSRESSGRYLGVPLVQHLTYSYERSGPSPYPMRVGFESETIVTESTAMTVMGRTQTSAEASAYTNVIEKKELITVPAGAFECFKIVKHGEGGTPSRTSWYSDEAKSNVKSIDYETGTVMQLVSYPPYSLAYAPLTSASPLPTPSPTRSSAQLGFDLSDAPRLLELSSLLPAQFEHVEAVLTGLSMAEPPTTDSCSETESYLREEPYQLIWGFVAMPHSGLETASMRAMLRDDDGIERMLRSHLLAIAESIFLLDPSDTGPELDIDVSHPAVGDQAILAVGSLAPVGIDYGLDVLCFGRDAAYVFLYSWYVDEGHVGLVPVGEGLDGRLLDW